MREKYWCEREITIEKRETHAIESCVRLESSAPAVMNLSSSCSLPPSE